MVDEAIDLLALFGLIICLMVIAGLLALKYERGDGE